MKIVQTFWSGGKDPMTDPFGWLTPQHHFMSWGMSCLALKENYNDIVLYTDSVGYAIFAEKLSLPYSKIIIQYDNLDCHPTHWAYAKLLTYSLQDKPFIHVDGDAYLPKRLSSAIESAGLIAQNREIGTDYYGNMIKHIIKNCNTTFPQFLDKATSKDSIPSYNAGVIGGNDLGFIKEYCNQAFEFIEKNNLRNPSLGQISINFNILFEQILFAALAEEHGKRVTTVLDHPIKDNEYSYPEFGDFYQFENTNLLHAIGGHKRNHRVCELLERVLLSKYPQYYSKIINLFEDKHQRISKKYIPNTDYHDYYLFLETLSIKWKDIDNEELLDLEKLSTNYFKFIQEKVRKKLKYKLRSNPHLEIFTESKGWADETKEMIRNKINADFKAASFEIACIPTLLNKGYKEVLIDDLSYNIITILEEEHTFDSLLDKLEGCTEETNNQTTDKLIDKAIEYLLYNKLIYVVN